MFSLISGIPSQVPCFWELRPPPKDQVLLFQLFAPLVERIERNFGDRMVRGKLTTTMWARSSTQNGISARRRLLSGPRDADSGKSPVGIQHVYTIAQLSKIGKTP